ncbi:MAG: LuxR family transcriptional regulator [Pseudomonadota bacterium]
MLDYVEKALATQDIAVLWDAHVAHMAAFGFTRLIYGFNRFTVDGGPGDHHDALILTAHDPEYLQEFIGQELYRHAPMLRWALSNSGAAPWSHRGFLDTARTPSETETRIMALNCRFGVTAGYTIAFPREKSRFMGIISLCGSVGSSQTELDEVWARHGRTIEAMNWVMHQRVSALPHAGSRRPLTDRQRQVLELIAEGRTIAGVAQVLGLSPATVEKHLRLARAALDVETTAAAIHKANWQNQMFIAKS